jgi:hypothetical protein
VEIETARAFVAAEIARIEQKYPNGISMPWEPDAVPDSSTLWGLVQQRIALSHPNPQNTACCRSLNLDPPERTLAQKRAAEANGRRLASARAA